MYHYLVQYFLMAWDICTPLVALHRTGHLCLAPLVITAAGLCSPSTLEPHQILLLLARGRFTLNSALVR